MGRTVTFACLSAKQAGWFYDKQYVKHGWQSRIDNTNYYKLVISDVQFNHAGIYVCQGYDEKNNLFLSQGILIVTGK